MAWIVLPNIFCVEGVTSRISECELFWKQGINSEDEAMRVDASSRWLFKRGIWTQRQTHTEERYCEDTWRVVVVVAGNGHWQSQERDWEQVLPSQPSGWTNSAYTLTSDSQISKVWKYISFVQATPFVVPCYTSPRILMQLLHFLPPAFSAPLLILYLHYEKLLFLK